MIFLVYEPLLYPLVIPADNSSSWNERETARNAVSTGSPPRSPRTENSGAPPPYGGGGGGRLFGQSFTRGIVTFATADNDNMTVFEYLSR